METEICPAVLVLRFEDTQQARKVWAREVAQHHEIALDRGEQHFVISIFNEQGKEVRREFIPLWKAVILETADGKRAKVSIQDFIEAVKSYPFDSSWQAVQKMYTKGVDYGYDGTEQ